MKWLLVALFAVVVLVANVAAFTDAEMRQRSWCYADYQCQNNCRCRYVHPGGLKMCMCPSPYSGRLENIVCRRSEFL